MPANPEVTAYPNRAEAKDEPRTDSFPQEIADNIRQNMTTSPPREETVEVARLARQRKAVDVKLARIRRGESLRVIDLFAGCGGMSLGFHRAGFTILGGVEKDPRAASVHASNFFSSCSPDDFNRHKTPRDIHTFTPADFMRDVLQAKQPELEVDVIVGGPPCQAFARIGRAKLREILQHPDAHLNDERASLYLPYLSYVEFFRPLAVLMENVPDIMNYGGQNVAENIAGLLEEMGYRCRYTILNAVHYGVPQMRQRFFLLALLEELDINPSFPQPTHYIRPSAGYTSVHRVALGGDGQPSRYIDPPIAADTLPPAITVEAALADLPPIPKPVAKRQGKKFDTLSCYRDIEPSAYVRELRNWPGFESVDGVLDHVTRYLPRDYPIFERMEPGDEYPEAHAIALQLFERAVRKRVRQEGEGRKLRRMGSSRPKGYRWRTRLRNLKQSLRKSIVPPYNPEKFPNKWWKLVPDRPSRTLTAHMGKDTYSHIHYSPTQPRVISVREAARLQSFPDGFWFGHSMNPAFTQIGNAVPPLLAYRLAECIGELLRAQVVNFCDRLAPALNIMAHSGYIQVTDLVWEFLEPLMPPRRQGRGRPRENRRMLSSILSALQRASNAADTSVDYRFSSSYKTCLSDWEETGTWLHICRTLRILIGDQSGVNWDVLLSGSKAIAPQRSQRHDALEHQQVKQISNFIHKNGDKDAEIVDNHAIFLT